MNMNSSMANEIMKTVLAPLPRRLAHSKGVAACARKLKPILGESAETLEAAAFLHDIGYAPKLVRTGFHPLDGAIYLHENGACGRIVNLVAHHSCAHIEAELRGLSSQLRQFPSESGALSDALLYCDMSTTPDGDFTDPVSRINEIKSRYGPTDLVTEFIQKARPEILAASARVRARMALYPM